ncbi:hypothetical protein EV13_1574 [Prochlorococcus sp. MIT 0702]|nr:hypothetical protein EV13_1574 [Prochlorococcus sp. MIT 0702]
MSMTPQQIISTKAPEDGSIRSSMGEEAWDQILPCYLKFKQQKILQINPVN